MLYLVRARARVRARVRVRAWIRVRAWVRVGQERAVHGGEAHAHDGLVDLLPEVEVALLVRVRVRVGDDVELAEGRAALVQHALRQDEPVAVVVVVREADAVPALA